MVYSFLKIVREKFGPDAFWKIVFGKYSPPKIEKKIFMFIDMKSSTTIAERLGYEKFSPFIQECFIDLNDILPQYHGEIYQYVGDEVIVVWDFEKGLSEDELFRFFYHFEEKLELRKDFYMNTFNEFPLFKAGVHGGDVVAAEVGIIKKEIAYHGDIMNTTSRIQDMCNSLNAKLLMSSELATHFDDSMFYKLDQKGSFLLKRKEHEVNITSITRVM